MLDVNPEHCPILSTARLIRLSAITDRIFHARYKLTERKSRRNYALYIIPQARQKRNFLTAALHKNTSRKTPARQSSYKKRAVAYFDSRLYRTKLYIHTILIYVVKIVYCTVVLSDKPFVFRRFIDCHDRGTLFLCSLLRVEHA